MQTRPQILYYSLLKHSLRQDTEEGVIDQAVDRLGSVQESLRGVTPSLQLAALVLSLKSFKCQTWREVQQRILETHCSISCTMEAIKKREISIALLGRALEAAAVCYAMQRFVKDYFSHLNGQTPQGPQLDSLLNAHGEKVLGSVARNIDLFCEQYVERTLEMHGTLLSLMHLRRSDPDVYKIITQQQRKCAAKRKVASRFRTVSMNLDSQEDENAPKATSLLQGRRAFSMEVHAGRVSLPQV